MTEIKRPDSPADQDSISAPKYSFVKYQLPAILWATAIFIASSIPQEYTPSIRIWNIDKAAHFLEFCILGILVSTAFYKSKHAEFRQRALTLALLVAVMWAASDEIHQMFVRGRVASIFDFIADAFGAVAARFSFPALFMRGPEQIEIKSREGLE